MKLQENKYKAKLHTMALVWRLCLGTTKGSRMYAFEVVAAGCMCWIRATNCDCEINPRGGAREI